jgi:hypothetical protein
MMDDDESTLFLWGYAVSYQQYVANTTRNPLGLVKCAKSKLLGTEYTEEDRTRIVPILDELIRRNIIQRYGEKPGVFDPQDVQDVITDFLTQLFIHTKNQLIILHGFSDACSVQFVMTVPTIWSPQSSRILQTCMESAIRASGFGRLGHGCIDNLFIISEPEAAATYLMAATKTMLVGLVLSWEWLS